MPVQEQYRKARIKAEKYYKKKIVNKNQEKYNAELSEWMDGWMEERQKRRQNAFIYYKL